MAGIAIVAIVSSVRAGQVDPDPAHSRTHVPEPELDLRPPGTAAHRAITDAWSNMLPMQLVVRFVAPVLALLSALIFLRGHNEPGGGFIAALVGSAIVGLQYLSTSTDRQIGPPRARCCSSASGSSSPSSPACSASRSATPSSSRCTGGRGRPPRHLDALRRRGLPRRHRPGHARLQPARHELGQHDPRRRRGTREHADEAVLGELTGPLDTVRGEPPARRPRVGVRTDFLASGTRPKEPGR